MVAGHETTSTGLTWTLFALTQRLDVQSKLREEVCSIDTDTPTMDVLAALPYLDKVVKESLRLYAPVPMTDRVAMQDDLIPVGTPYVDRQGKLQDHIAYVCQDSIHHPSNLYCIISIGKGDKILIPLLMMNRSKFFWGEDALEFRRVLLLISALLASDNLS